jgi:uncharacterized protein YijF (DUF1287 family)
LLPLLRAQQTVASEASADALIGKLAPSADFGERLASAALQQSKSASIYDTAYYQITYPYGDIPKGGAKGDTQKGKAEDLLIRSYRSLGIDLQQLVHEDMTRNFSSYPQLWGSRAPDSNIDHRRIENLQRYFKHVGAELPATREKGDYKTGDVVVWMLAQGELHCGIVVPGPDNRSDEAWVVHDNGQGPKWENVLTEFSIHGHYRFIGQSLEVAKR